MNYSKTLAEIKESAKTLFSAIITLISPLITAVGVLLKRSWKLVAGALILFAIAFTAVVFCKKDACLKISTQYCVYKYKKLDRYRVKDMQQNKWTTGWLASVSKDFGCDSLVRISKKDIFGNNELYGYLDVRTGAVAIEPQYQFVGEFSEGLAPIRHFGKDGFINTSGELVVTVKGTIMNRPTLKMRNGYAIVNINNKYGILSNKGEWVVEPAYDEIEKSDQNCYIVSTEFWMGLWSVEKGWLVEPNCVEISSHDEGFYVLGLDRAYIIGADGNIINPFVFCYSEPLSYPTAGDDETTRRISDYVLFAIADKCYGVYNVRTNKIILPAKYTDIDMASKDLFVVADALGIKYFVDKNGNAIGEN